MDGVDKLHKMLHGPGKPAGRLLIGEIRSDKPLQVETGGLVLQAHSLWLPPRLKLAHRDDPQHLNPGDRVVLFTADTQIFYILDKEVRS